MRKRSVPVDVAVFVAKIHCHSFSGGGKMRIARCVKVIWWLFCVQGIAVVDNLLLVTAFPIYCVEPFVEYTGLCEGYYQYARAIVLVHIFPLTFIAQTATVWSTVLIGVNRYIAVCHPYQVRHSSSLTLSRYNQEIGSSGHKHIETRFAQILMYIVFLCTSKTMGLP
jgi:hypothetical protein